MVATRGVVAWSVSARESRRWVLAAATVFTAGAAYRFLTLDGFPNDHFTTLTPAWQMVSLGDLPTRDYVDPGLPLMIASSALFQALFGPTLFSEALLVVLAFGTAAVFTLFTVRALSGSLLLAAGAVAFEVAIYPRTYSYPKILIYPAAFLLFLRYVARPTTGRLFAMAAATAVAFLFRHDHGLFVGVGGVLTAALAPAQGNLKARVNRAVVLIAAVGALVLPYLVYVQMTQGIWLYLRTGIEFSRREAMHSVRIWPSLFGPERPYGVMVWLYHALPVAVGVAALAARTRNRHEHVIARIVPIAAVAVLVNLTFLRDPPATRVPDAIVPAVVLGAWLTGQAQAAKHRAALVPMAIALIAAAAWATILVGHMSDQVERMALTTVMSVPERFEQRARALHARFDPHQVPTHTVTKMVPFFEYLDRCTATTDRLLTGGFMPEVPYFARRGFAGGQNVFMYGYFGSDENQREVVDRLRRQEVPFVLIPSDYADDLRDDFPTVNAYVSERYRPLVTTEIDEGFHVAVLVDRMREPVSRDGATGWPCFR